MQMDSPRSANAGTAAVELLPPTTERKTTPSSTAGSARPSAAEPPEFSKHKSVSRNNPARFALSLADTVQYAVETKQAGQDDLWDRFLVFDVVLMFCGIMPVAKERPTRGWFVVRWGYSALVFLILLSRIVKHGFTVFGPTSYVTSGDRLYGLANMMPPLCSMVAIVFCLDFIWRKRLLLWVLRSPDLRTDSLQTSPAVEKQYHVRNARYLSLLARAQTVLLLMLGLIVWAGTNYIRLRYLVENSRIDGTKQPFVEPVDADLFDAVGYALPVYEIFTDLYTFLPISCWMLMYSISYHVFRRNVRLTLEDIAGKSQSTQADLAGVLPRFLRKRKQSLPEDAAPPTVRSNIAVTAQAAFQNLRNLRLGWLTPQKSKVMAEGAKFELFIDRLMARQSVAIFGILILGIVLLVIKWAGFDSEFATEARYFIFPVFMLGFSAVLAVHLYKNYRYTVILRRIISKLLVQQQKVGPEDPNTPNTRSKGVSQAMPPSSMADATGRLSMVDVASAMAAPPTPKWTEHSAASSRSSEAGPPTEFRQNTPSSTVDTTMPAAVVAAAAGEPVHFLESPEQLRVADHEIDPDIFSRQAGAGAPGHHKAASEAFTSASAPATPSASGRHLPDTASTAEFADKGDMLSMLVPIRGTIPEEAVATRNISEEEEAGSSGNTVISTALSFLGLKASEGRGYIGSVWQVFRLLAVQSFSLAALAFAVSVIRFTLNFPTCVDRDLNDLGNPEPINYDKCPSSRYIVAFIEVGVFGVVRAPLFHWLELYCQSHADAMYLCAQPLGTCLLPVFWFFFGKKKQPGTGNYHELVLLGVPVLCGLITTLTWFLDVGRGDLFFAYGGVTVSALYLAFAPARYMKEHAKTYILFTLLPIFAQFAMVLALTYVLVPYYVQASDPSQKIWLVLVVLPLIRLVWEQVLAFFGASISQMAARKGEFQLGNPWFWVVAIKSLLNVFQRLFLFNVEQIQLQVVIVLILAGVEIIKRVLAPFRTFAVWFVWTRGDKAVAYRKMEKYRTSVFHSHVIYMGMLLELTAIIYSVVYSIFVRSYYDLPLPSKITIGVSVSLQIFFVLVAYLLSVEVEEYALDRKMVSLWLDNQRMYFVTALWCLANMNSYSIRQQRELVMSFD